MTENIATQTPPSKPFMVQVQGLSKNFGSRQNNALSDLTFDIPKGEVFGLIGANGAGKSTALRIMATVIPPERGDVFVDGKSVRHQPEEVRRIIGYVPDEYGLYAEMQVDEYLEFFAACYGIHGKKRTRLVNELLDLVDLQSRRKQLLKGLSRGMRQRLCLAHALVHDPQVLLLDEPASGLDPRAHSELRELVRELAAMGKTIVISSHALPDVQDICDRIGVMAKGRMLDCGPTIEIVAKSAVGVRSRRILLRVVSPRDLEMALMIAPNFPRLDKSSILADRANRQLQVDIDGDQQTCAAFLSFLTVNRVAVAHFTERGTGLEDLFTGEI